MKNTEPIVDGVLLSVGSAFSLANLDDILGIIILVIQAVWICVKMVVKIINTIKSGGSLTDIDEDVGILVDKIEEISNTVEEGEVDNVNEPNG